MGATEEIIKMAKENNGTVTTAMVVAAGISRGNIKYLVDKGMIEKSARGVYILPEVWVMRFLICRVDLNEESILMKQHCFFGI